MPTTPVTELPRTESAEEFEKICESVCSKIYKTDFKIYGRKGQVQDGIDLYARASEDGNLLYVVQCKNYRNERARELRVQLEKDIQSAADSQLKSHIKKYIIATSIDPDVTIQNFILKKEFPFPVEIIFWNKIEEVLLENRKLLKKFYPSLLPSNKHPLGIAQFTARALLEELYIPLEERNQIIQYVETLKSYASAIHEKYPDYAISPSTQDTKAIAQIVSQMISPAGALRLYYNTKRIQLNHLGVSTVLSRVIQVFSTVDLAQSTKHFRNTNLSFAKTLVPYFTDEEFFYSFSEDCEAIINTLLSCTDVLPES